MSGQLAPPAPQQATLDYECRVPGFEGPLAVLLRLIERQELDITAISLALVADQFIAYLDEQPVRDLALLADFGAVASRLLLLKTRMLFPRAIEATGDPADEADGDDLVRQLLEYRRFKEAAEGLAARDRAGARTFAPVAAPAHATAGAIPEVTLAPARPRDLVRAVQRRLARQPATPQRLALVPQISIGEMVARIADFLRALPRGEVRFSRLIRGASSCTEIVTTFMAILELVRRRRAEATQDRPFGEIVLLPLAAGVSLEAPDTAEAAADD